ncbi:oxidoreductase [Roseibium aquae]|uniref:Oxidoreductase n=1 Tax=Roseibium aquae TaxID=1323746 RepID=A0A916X2J5_9HYPH|nr:SDR family oxidoreductase [Roseibium aquae]GGB53894.1 oxidoreductase [Roseibium aquae]
MIAGKHVVISGGGTGVGAAVAKTFAGAGARVCILGRTEETLKAQNLPYAVCDVTKADDVKAALEKARKEFGVIDIAIANAGAAESVPFSKMDQGTLERMMAVNVTGVFNLWQAAFYDMKAAGWGRMIAIASTAGLKGYPYVSGYCAAKHAVVGLTRSIAMELGPTGITANAICPGFVETPMLERSIETIVAKTGMSRDLAAKSLRKGNPQDRFIQTGEVADAALWLCSEGARSVNGHTLTLSGGEI